MWPWSPSAKVSRWKPTLNQLNFIKRSPVLLTVGICGPSSGIYTPVIFTQKTEISFKFSLKRKVTNTKAMGVEVFARWLCSIDEAYSTESYSNI